MVAHFPKQFDMLTWPKRTFTFNDPTNGEINLASSVNIATFMAGLQAITAVWAWATWYMLCVEKTEYDLFSQSVATDEWLLCDYWLIIDWAIPIDTNYV